jgi:dTDP-4-dehydrorhamnose 3,5-epimerase
MDLTPLGIEGAWLASSPIWADDRGSFREWFKSSDVLALTGVNFGVLQANISTSVRGVVRGIHYSLAQPGQAKWITCVTGEINDVIVDIRPESITFGKHINVNLKGNSGLAVFIGEGLGHGFAALADESTVAYLISSPFSPNYEFEINPIDPALEINWGLPAEELLLSKKDSIAPNLFELYKLGKLPRC